MLRLLTFGGLTLQVRNSIISGVATQRRRVALFAALAATGERGMSRDKLLSVLWPESDDERARHALAQLLYAQRRELETEELFLGNKTLRLNPAVMTSDVGDFQTALAANDLAGALRLYDGRFLDGFHLPDTPAFDHWLEDQRSRLTGLAAGAATTLAQAANTRGDHAAAAEWWQAASRADPYRAHFVLGVIAAREAMGDRASALQEAVAYQTRLERELELPVEPEVEAAIVRLRGK